MIVWRFFEKKTFKMHFWRLLDCPIFYVYDPIGELVEKERNLYWQLIKRFIVELWKIDTKQKLFIVFTILKEILFWCQGLAEYQIQNFCQVSTFVRYVLIFKAKINKRIINDPSFLCSGVNIYYDRSSGSFFSYFNHNKIMSCNHWCTTA